MKTTNIIQRLCLFFFALLLAPPAGATNYGREGYETFRSRNLGTHKKVTTLKQGKVEITFSSCTTSGSSGNGAIYQPAKGSRITVKADDGYSIRWIILRDTEGGESYRHPKGKYRISSVTSGYKYYFEKEAVSNSYIKGHNENNLNDDDDNIVVYQYDASAQSVEIRTHNRRDWDQFKVRDIIVGYVRAPKVRFKKDRYDMYYMPIFHPQANYDDHSGSVGYKLNNNDIATVNANGLLKFKRPGTVVLTATCSASENCAKAQCKTTVTTKRDGVTFTAVGLPDVLFSNTPHNLRDYLYNSKTKSGKNFDYKNWSFSVTSSNNAVLRYDDRRLKFGGTAGEVTITFTQKESNFYEATTFSHTFIVARRDQDGTILIKDAAEWKAFCKIVNEKGMTNLNARLEADINLGGDIAMIGRYDHKYAGTFDGQNHTLTLNWNTGESDIAPFRRVDGATIKNLRTAGTIKSSGHFLAGLIDEASGDNNTISNCVSAVNITSSYTSDRCGAGGLISYIFPSARVTINDCLVTGDINATTDEGKKGMGGFVYTNNGTCKLTNCLYAGTNNGSNEYSYTFAMNADITNCYYLNACGSEYKQDTKVTAEQLRNGEVAWMLQKGRSDMAWGQKIGRDDTPQLTRDNDKRICKVTFAYNGREEATRYANKGGTVASMPTFTAKDLLGSDYNEHHYYSEIAFEDGFNGSTTVTSDKQVRINLTEKDCYEIASADNWKEFCNIVNNSGQNAVDAKLTQDVNLGSDIWQVGNHYAGTFDGQGHTLKINWNDTSGWLAPFKTVDGATIKNLRTEGEIKSSLNFLSGLVREAYGNTTISGCVSAVNITSSYNDGGCDAAGIIECVRDNAKVTITDCVVKGKFTATTEKGRRYMSGFVNNQYGTCTLNNCLYLGSGNGDRFSRTFVGDAYYGATTTLNNCYYLNTCGKAQGTKITAEQLKSGEVTKKLQADRTDKCYWAQQLGEMPDFYNAADKSKINYVYYKVNNGWACDDFRLTDGQPLPIGLDFTAATVTYERNFNGTQNATLCLPYDLSAQGFKAYTLSGGNKNEVHFKEVDDKLTAYTPYYITANGMPQLGGRNIEVKAYKADKMTTPAAGYKFTGTVAGVSNATAAAANAYILQDDGKFHKVTTANSAATIPAYRAYIICPPQASGAKQLSVVLDGETTGIGSTTNEATDGKNGPVYDLQGRRVADRLDDARHRLPAGVYIVGGRKVVVK